MHPSPSIHPSSRALPLHHICVTVKPNMPLVTGMALQSQMHGFTAFWDILGFMAGRLCLKQFAAQFWRFGSVAAPSRKMIAR